MLKIIIDKFIEKHPDFDFNKFLVEFESGKSREELEDIFNIKTASLRRFVYALNLDFVKSRRVSSIKEFRHRMVKESGENLDLVGELESEIETLANKNKKLYHSLTMARDEANALRKESRYEAREENVIENIYSIAEECIQKSILDLEIPKIQYIRESQKREGKAFILLSDLHYNEIINPRYIEGYNSYNNQVCLSGIDKLFKEVVKYNTDTLKIYLAGDLISGKLHGLDKKGQVPLTESIIELATFLATRINEVSSLYENVEVTMVNGNHSRLYDKPVSDLKAFDFEHLLYAIMKAQFINKNIKSHYSLSGYAIDNIGTLDNPKYLGIHHLDMKRFNVTSNSDILKQMEIFDEMFKVRTISLMGGHQHTPVFTTTNRGGNVFVNGCMSASNEYGFNGDYLPIQPYQWIGIWSTEGYAEEQKCVRIR